jgi:hypothetical protein
MNLLDKVTLNIQRVWLVVGAVVLAAAIAFGAVQYLRVEGYKFFFFKWEGYKPAYERVVAENNRIILAQDEAERLQRALNQDIERQSAALSERIDNNAKADTRTQLAVADSYIAANRVRTEACGDQASAAVATSADNRTGSSEAASAPPDLDDARVAVTADDVRICTVNTIQAEAGRAFALEVEALTAPK